MFTVASHCQIMAQLDLKDLSHNLHVNYVISFFCLSIFNTPYMYSNVRCDGKKKLPGGSKHPLQLLILVRLWWVSEWPIQSSAHQRDSSASMTPWRQGMLGDNGEDFLVARGRRQRKHKRGVSSASMEERLRAQGIHLEDAKLLAVDLAEMCSVAPSRQRTVLVVQRSIRSLAGLVRRPARGARRRGSGSKDAEDAAPAPCRIHGAPIPRARRARRTPSRRRTCNDQAWATARMAQPVGGDGGSGGGGAWRRRSRGHRPTTSASLDYVAWCAGEIPGRDRGRPRSICEREWMREFAVALQRTSWIFRSEPLDTMIEWLRNR